MFEQRLRGYGLWQPLPAPHTRTAYCTSERVLVGLHRGQWSHPGRSSDLDGDSGRLQNGEGWTPRSSDQSILELQTIDYRPLASEELTPPAIERACLKGAGVKAFRALLGWRASAEPLLPPLIASGPAWAARSHGRMTTLRDQNGTGRADQCAAAKLHRTCVEDSRRLTAAIWRAQRKPPAVKHPPRRGPRGVRKGQKTASQRIGPRRLPSSRS
jgi:hypothetical protein